MTLLLECIVMALILWTSGYIVIHRLLRSDYGNVLEILFALPIAALLCALATAVLTLASIPLSFWSILISLLLICSFFIISIQPFIKTKNNILHSELCTVPVPRVLVWIASAVLCSSLVYGITHALLPTVHYDSLTNWNMRSKVSYFRAEIVFDDMNNLVSKVQYPFLFHALQIAVQQLLPTWSDQAANGIHLLLMLSAVFSVWCMLSVRGWRFATVVVALVIGMPLMTLHGGQSYADSTLVSFAMLSLCTLIVFRKNNDRRMLLLSGMFLAACVWTKTEGLFFCYVPWVVVLALVLVRRKETIHELRAPVAYGILLSLSWPIFAAIKGLSLTPHGSADTTLSFTSDAAAAMIDAMFVSGSFGLFWYGLCLVLLLFIVGSTRGMLSIDSSARVTVLWGLLSMLGYMGVYLFTSNTQYLIIGQSFDRQMLLPAALLTISLSMALTPKRE